MIRFTKYIICSLLLLTCYEFSFGQESPYKIEKLEKVKSYYVIYASKNDTTFKIVSKREPVSNCNKIKRSNSYNLKFSEVILQCGSQVNCFNFPDKTVVCKDDNFGLYVATNLKGLCLID